MLDDESFELGDRRSVVGQSQFGVDADFDGVDPATHEPLGFVGRERLVGEVGQSRAPPQTQGPIQSVSGLRRPPGRQQRRA
jgi:hypothetical protein